MKNELNIEEYFNGVKSNDRSILSRAITLIESSKKAHQILINKPYEVIGGSEMSTDLVQKSIEQS